MAVGEKPAQPIEKSLAGPGLLAHVITRKYCDHLPLHRQEGILKRHGVDLARTKRHGLDPFAYLRDLLRRIPTHPNRDIEELFPDQRINSTN